MVRAGLVNEQRDPKDDQQQAADELDGARMGRHDIGNGADAERGDRGEHAVAEHGAKARGKPGPKAARHRPLNDQHVDRPDRRRHHDADADAGKHELDGGENDLRACLQGHGLFALRGWRERGSHAAWARRALALVCQSAKLIEHSRSDA